MQVDGRCRSSTAVEELRRSLGQYNRVKVGLVLALLIYVIVITAVHYTTDRNDEQKRRKLEFIQDVLFGHSGVMIYIFALIIFTLLLVIFMPFFTKLWTYHSPMQRRMQWLLDSIGAAR